MNRVAVLMTSHNRREVTLASLRSLHEQTGIEETEVSILLVDDGSTDGTANAVKSKFPKVQVLEGNGSLYWNRGMHKAFHAALREGFNAYILFNDDTRLYADAVNRLLACAEARILAEKPAIIAASIRSPITGEHSYGGWIMLSRGLSRQLVRVLPHSSDCLSCDTMNGNLTLIPAQVAQVIGNLEERFHHHYGDVDYGLRAKRAGFEVIVPPGYFGECSDNSSASTWRDKTLPFKKRWKNLMSPKGAPVRQWILYTWRHYGWRFPLYAASPYVKTILSSFLRRAR